MAAKVVPTNICVAEGPSFIEHTEDGPATTWNVFVGATIGGKDYVHFRSFPRHRRFDCERLADRIRAAGAVDLAHWVELEPRPSLEMLFDAYAEREDEVRRGLRAEEDMFHGL